ncbi:hypothetical protein V6N13_082898 [Hibiscus sabdariffa]|uniref:E2F/DP family winged-helix DNA-binding domain-containing protein n=1 Tax=Hibiscus sabdariffa TaxID=183260 RepID=A0ABR2BZT3_9ROSI
MARSSEDPSCASQFQFRLPHSHSQPFITESNENQKQPLSHGEQMFPTYLGRPPLLFSSFDHTNTRLDHFHSAYATPALKHMAERENGEAQTSGRVDVPEHNKVFTYPLLEAQHHEGVKHNSKAKRKKNAMSGAQKSNSESPNALNGAGANCRYDSSLGLLTKKFVNLIMEAKDGTLDLNRTAEVLEVQKRRIYDITNVLEGIGLIEKTLKNHIRWKRSDDMGSKQLDDQVTSLKAEIQSLYAEERRLDDYIREKQQSLSSLNEDANYQKHLFLTEEDITSLPCFQNQTVFAIKAPQYSYIEVPDPDEDKCFSQRQYKMIIRSHNGPIDLYLLSKYGQVEDITAKQAVSMDTSCSHGMCGVQHPEPSSENNNSSKTVDLLCPEKSGIPKIIPTVSNVIDDDYWFRSDPEVSITQLWDA